MGKKTIILWKIGGCVMYVCVQPPMELDEILLVLKTQAAKITKSGASDIRIDLPLSALGLDSMQGMQLHSVIEARFSCAIPEAIMFEPDTTLITIAQVLQAGGILPTPVTLVNAPKLADLEANYARRFKR